LLSEFSDRHNVKLAEPRSRAGPLQEVLHVKRRRFKQTTASQIRLTEEADRLKRKAHDMPPCSERSIILDKAQQMQEAAEMTDFLTMESPHGSR
jgi:hypothetical protein